MENWRIFLQRRPVWRNARCTLPSLSVTLRGEPEEQVLCEEKREWETLSRIKGRGGNIVRRRGVPIITDFGWERASRRTHGNAPDEIRSVTEPPWEKRGSLRCCSFSCCLSCPVPPWLRWDTETCAEQSQSSGGHRRPLSSGCRVWAPGLTLFLWRRWSGNPAKGWKCQRDTNQVQLKTPARRGSSSPVRRKDAFGFFQERLSVFSCKTFTQIWTCSAKV